ncbi:MAG: galactose oxidase-like domain-containing protein, partial [Granulosicoccaceae bacterium]
CLLSSTANLAQAHGNEQHQAVPATPVTQSRALPILQSAPQPDMLPTLGGAWSAVYDWPIVAVHAALLANGKVLAWDATPDDADDDPHTTDNFTTRVTLWDPIQDTHTATNNNTDTDLFCAGSAHLWDGRILFAGGDGGKAGANGPLSNSNIYNPLTNTWHRTSNMQAPRWYSSVAALSNGEMLTFGGSYSPNPSGEVFQFDQNWRPLKLNTPYAFEGDYQWLQATPEGAVMSFGPQNLLAMIDTEGEGSWANVSERDDVTLRDYGSYAMYDIGKILVAGGGNSVATAVVIDTATGQSSSAGNLNIGRRQHNLTILADGSVLATGGNTDGTRYISPEAPALQAELWNPATSQWRLLNPMQRDRQYHSIALLMPDGTVLSAGGGICGDCYRLGYEERNAEIFTPPYLYNSNNMLATRPPLTDVPASIDYGDTMLVDVGNAAAIDRAHLIKLGSTTHSENQDQRLVPLSFSRSGSNINLSLPDSRDVAPPGHYLLFVVDQHGVPSRGTVVKLGTPLLAGSGRVVNTLERGAIDNYRIAAEPGTTDLVLSAAGDISLAVRADASGANNVCSSATANSSIKRCQFASSVASDWIVTIDGSQRVDYQLDVTFDGQAIPEPQDSLSNGESDEGGDSAADGAVVVVGGGATAIGSLLVLLIFLTGTRLSRPYCYTATSILTKQPARECV